ncbi:MAG TPA: hypothetical protein VF927_10205 [Solirubrobacteraceae bacterium]
MLSRTIVAYVVHELTGVDTASAELFVVDQAVLLDEGSAIDPASLALSAGTLRWSDAGSIRTARMP